jgi:hypothetical protein
MDRVVLIALLGIPLLVIVDVALFSRPITPISAMSLINLPGLDRDRLHPDGRLQSPQAIVPSQIVIKPVPEQGS